MQDIKQCKECGHENPKKFMSYEYTSHAPNCSQDIKQRKYPQEMLLMNDCPNCGQETNREFVEKVIDDIISLAVEQERERVLAMVLKELQKPRENMINWDEEVNHYKERIKNLSKQ